MAGTSEPIRIPIEFVGEIGVSIRPQRSLG
jgi:hypothetical protein